MRPAAGVLCVVCQLLLTAGCPSGPPAERPAPADPDASAPVRSIPMADRRLSGPFVHQNLAVFLVHGAGGEPAGALQTLDEAVAAETLIVHETGDVSELALENTDPKVSVYVQAGFIVKGGRQDRILAHDLVVPPNSGRVPIASFCVERGRWSGRGGESAARFQAASKMAVGNELNHAARRAGDQQLVWRNVAAAQRQLSANVGASVHGAASPSSLQLALEHPELEKRVKEYTDALAGVLAQAPDAVGAVFAVNGQLRSADIYASAALFAKLYPKLLEAAATEAFADLKPDRPAAGLAPETAAAWLAQAADGRTATRRLSNGVEVITVENDQVVRFDTTFTAADIPLAGGAAQPCLLHQNFLLPPDPAGQGPSLEGNQPIHFQRLSIQQSQINVAPEGGGANAPLDGNLPPPGDRQEQAP